MVQVLGFVLFFQGFGVEFRVLFLATSVFRAWALG